MAQGNSIMQYQEILGTIHCFDSAYRIISAIKTKNQEFYYDPNRKHDEPCKA